MYRPPNKPSPTSVIALVLVLLMLTFIISPAAAAQSGTQGTARRHDVRRPVAGLVIRRENGIETDDDGIIGNGRWGADRAPLPRRAHRARRTMDTMTATQLEDGILPDRSTAPHRSDESTDRRGRDLMPHVEDGQIEDKNTTDGHVDAPSTDDHVGAPSTDDQGTEQPPMTDATGKESDSPARSLLPWVIVSVGILAVLLIALALMPKKGRGR
jgi:hypothetical protein